ncbi:unnamed protein product [Paramecium primaurelia]|uniref:RING-type domain-containing protein n=1 Tax=Paramecium primaurelia TaxID=5886 RepID=A0A8S1LSI2_PARPR|nr:unnamed protein product [Paramecium primaurelia]
MYYPYAIEESDENISQIVSNQDLELDEDEDFIQDSYQSPERTISSNSDNDFKEEQFVDQSRIINLSEVKVFLDEVICPICCHIIIDPKICSECDQTFCGKCILRWFQKSPNHQCPCCRKDLNKKNGYYNNQSIMDDKVPKVMLKLLSKLMLTCRYRQDGCEEIISYDFREKHENQYCQYQEQCCDNVGCYETMLRKDFEDHQLECRYGIVQCKYCQEDKLRMDIELHLQQCDCRPILCEWCQEKYQYIEIDEHRDLCEFKNILCEYCNKQYKKYDMKTHTPIFCLTQLNKQKDQIILELKKENQQLKQNKPMEQSDLNQSTNEILSEKYKQDFEEEVEEVIEENIQIEDSDQEQSQQYDNNVQDISIQDQKSQTLSDDENQDKQSNTNEKLDIEEIPSIQEIKMRGMYTSFLEKLTDIKFKDLWDYSEDEFNQVIDLLK